MPLSGLSIKSGIPEIREAKKSAWRSFSLFFRFPGMAIRQGSKLGLFPPFLKVAYLNGLAHLLKTGGQLLHQVHLNAEIDGQIRILVSGIDGPAHVEINVRGFLK